MSRRVGSPGTASADARCPWEHGGGAPLVSEPCAARAHRVTAEGSLGFGMNAACGPHVDAAPAFDGGGMQRLFDFLTTFRNAFSTEPNCELPSSVAAGLLAHLQDVHSCDVGVSPATVASIACRTGIGYMGIYSGPDMTICLFMLRRGAIIPLHDHPGMRVYGRLLFGRMRVCSFDPLTPIGGGAFTARLRSDRVLGPEPATYSLGPQEGNVHELEALEDCAFFDLLTPSYDPPTGRDCTYYRREPLGTDSGHVATLVPFDPRGFAMDKLEYLGPPCSL